MSAARARGHLYFMDGDRKVAPPIHAHWYTRSGILDLNEKLRSPPVGLRLRAIGKEVPPATRNRLTSEAVRLTREVTASLFQKLKPLALQHLLNYPLPDFDPARFASPVAAKRASDTCRRPARTIPRFRHDRSPRSTSSPPTSFLGRAARPRAPGRTPPSAPPI